MLHFAVIDDGRKLLDAWVLCIVDEWGLWGRLLVCFDGLRCFLYFLALGGLGRHFVENQTIAFILLSGVRSWF